MSAQKKRNFQIEAFKHRVVVDPKYAEKTWKILEHAIHEIYNHNASGLSFEELYRLLPLLFISLVYYTMLFPSLFALLQLLDGTTDCNFRHEFCIEAVALRLLLCFAFVFQRVVSVFSIFEPSLKTRKSCDLHILPFCFMELGMIFICNYVLCMCPR